MPNFRHRLTRTQQRTYDCSTVTSAIPLRAPPRLRQAVAALPDVLVPTDRGRVERAAQAIAEEITAALVRLFVNTMTSGGPLPLPGGEGTEEYVTVIVKRST